MEASRAGLGFAATAGGMRVEYNIQANLAAGMAANQKARETSGRSSECLFVLGDDAPG